MELPLIGALSLDAVSTEASWGGSRQTARRGAVLQPRAPARRPRASAPLPAPAGRPDLEPQDRPWQGLRSRTAPRAGRRRLSGHGPAAGDQGAPAPMTQMSTHTVR